ncbi:hypothetical protein JAO05_28290 [Burkholderia pseudomallei]|uniref:helicase-related protein n=1 Tax=Burkholderia pseudomallei TaxID=28450 RepID=UPI0018DE4AB9|nr:helicase-related protein [Burkholderia pseudomallei]MBH9659000.1 hypothetical protein [Burkholderia pseudomallei]
MADEAVASPYVPTYRDELALVRHLIGVLEEKLAGRDSVRRVNTHPLDWCHLGILGPVKGGHHPVELEAEQVEADADQTESALHSAPASTATPKVAAAPAPKAASEADEGEPVRAQVEGTEDIQGTRRPPSALGFEILLKPDEQGLIEIAVDASFCIFSKHLPTLKEQSSVLESGVSAGAPLVEVVQRWPIQVPGVVFRVNVLERRSVHDDGVVQAELDRTVAQAASRADAERIWPGNRPKLTNPDVLKNEANFTAHLSSLTGGLQVDRSNLEGSLELRVSPRPDGLVRVGCYICNDTPETARDVKGRGLKDAFLIMGDATLHAAVNVGELHPIEILPVPQDYQYDRQVWAVGHNASVRVNQETKEIKTAALAQFEQIRIATVDSPPAKFADLAADPFAALQSIYAAMLEYETDWWERVLARNALELDPDALEQCKRDHTGFVDEIRRFACGIAALRADERLLAAFKAANRVFGKLAKGYCSWRLFQIVFIVTQLPSLAIREGISAGEFPQGQRQEWADTLDWGDVLWFRTGGGKTEAYLGLACCAMLYDRLRGKAFGVTAWLRFPLRMLSIQQLQRAMGVIWESEQERRFLLGAEASKSDPIRLGYFVGGTTTPNSVNKELLERYTTEDSLEALRVIPDCPACGDKGMVKVSTDLVHLRFQHVCSACKAELPLDICDDEVYRYLPALVVGTIDKMATVGMQVKYGMLWGGAKKRCHLHGYGLTQYCSAFGCTVDKSKQKRSLVTPYDPAPAIHIQDELHLLQEELGAFAGHYETLVRYCEKAISGRPSKVVAATATIEGFERQVQHLYGVKNARRFPGRGYHRHRNFYGEPDLDPQDGEKTARLFVAFKSASLTPADASAYCTEILQTEITNLVRNPEAVLAIVKDAQTLDDVSALLRYYTTTLNYVGSLPRGSRVRQALEDAGTKVRPDGAREFNVEYHSSRSTSAEVADVVHRVESPPPWQDKGFLDALVATNMISHGVDLERVNLMAMDGVPEETAEYIQASSRAGRKHVGMVVVVLAGFSVRAASIYHRFLEYHQHLDRMVSPVPVNRFAKYAATRTLPGVALGVIYGRHAAETGSSALNKRNEVVNLLNDLGAGFLNEVKEAYFLGERIYDDRLERALTQTLTEGLETVEMSIRNSHEDYVKDAVRPSPMTSLRDVEVGVQFWPDTDARLLMYVQKIKE